MTTSTTQYPKFICEYALFRVAKQLRLLGYDVLCDKKFTPAYIIFYARTQERTVLCSSKKLITQLEKAERQRTRKTPAWEVYSDDSSDDAEEEEVKPLNWLVVSNNSFEEQLKLVFGKCGVKYDPTRTFTRCLQCGTTIEAIDRQLVKDRVPASVFLHYANFYHCGTCDKVFWGIEKGNKVCNWKAMHTLKYIRMYCKGAENASGVESNVDGDIHWNFHFFKVLPLKIKFQVLGFLTNEDINSISLSSKSYFELTNSDAVWKYRLQGLCKAVSRLPAAIGSNQEKVQQLLEECTVVYNRDAPTSGVAQLKLAKGARPADVNAVWFTPCQCKKFYLDLKRQLLTDGQTPASSSSSSSRKRLSGGFGVSWC
eukprot:TRINITY_DN66249_c2_g2_i1.p1 TRINITY_DN66249_c2_g2~~TRINITY_DN66249_c2_g2_i1.p1  ORF type:complete len:369 (+),score=25.97 TRINITY_DN66249_c2_g2_i1:69-1175(+)